MYPDNPLALTGPMALHECYEEHMTGVSVTYHDTRDAAYPYSGMRGKDCKLVAFEVPYQNNNNDGQQQHRDGEEEEEHDEKAEEEEALQEEQEEPEEQA